MLRSLENKIVSLVIKVLSFFYITWTPQGYHLNIAILLAIFC